MWVCMYWEHDVLKTTCGCIEMCRLSPSHTHTHNDAHACAHTHKYIHTQIHSLMLPSHLCTHTGMHFRKLLCDVVKIKVESEERMNRITRGNGDEIVGVS